MSEETRFVVESLDRETHDRAAFDCGVPDLNTYLQRQARQDQERGATAVFVLREREGTPRLIVGYYTLSATSVELTCLPPDIRKKFPRYPLLPAALIGRLAVSVSYHRQGVGGYLLVHGLKRAVRLSQTDIGMTAVIVDAMDDRARHFYERYGFLRDVTNEYRLFLPIDTIAKAF